MCAANSFPHERTPLLPNPSRRARFDEDPDKYRQPTFEDEEPQQFGRRSMTARTASVLTDCSCLAELDHVTTARSGDMNDIRHEFVLKLLEAPELQDPKIDMVSLAKGQAKLLDALEGRLITNGVEENLPNVIMFKGRPLSQACVLHLALWCSKQLRDVSLVELILKKQDDPVISFGAKYELPSRKEGWNVELRLDALHIACGLGCLPSVQTLVRNAACGGTYSDGPLVGSNSPVTPGSKSNKSVRDYVNNYTVKYHWNIEAPSQQRKENFYMPIHEAVAQGFIDVALYLLQNGADGDAPNSDGVAPLHFLAMQGCAGGIRTGMAANDSAAIRQVVHALQDSGGSLEARVNRQHYNPKWAGKTPLQLAAADDTRFPRQMMGLLVPCLQERSVREPRFFADVAFLTALDAEAATNVVREISSRSSRNNSVLQRFRVDAQMSGRTDLIASILFLAPEAGGLMLEMLVGDPIVKDVSKHNIPTRTSLYGFWRHLPMRCIYRSDVVSRDNVLLPVWKFETDRPIDQQPEIRWHSWLVPETNGLVKRTDYVYNVSVSTVLLPNILDLDMFMALARSLRCHMKVFAKLPVQGMIYCMWNNLVEGVWLSDLIFQLLELFFLMWWSIAWPVYGPRGAIHADEPFCWAVVTAGVIRETVQLLQGFRVGILKHRGHTDPTMRSMWNPSSEVFVKWALPKAVCILMQAKFVMGSRHHLDDSELSDVDQVFLAITVLLKATLVTYMFRLCTGGSKIYAIFYSFLGGATREMISITAMIFGSFSLAFLVLAKDKAAGWVIASSYRGLLFGDGDGFNNLGMDVHEDSYTNNDGILMSFLVLGSFFFNIILLNLIIAVYGNEYDKVAGETPFLFLHGRAENCVTYILSCQLFPWRGQIINSMMWYTSGILAVCGAVNHMSYMHQTWEFMTTVLFALAQVLLLAAQAQAEWFSLEGLAANGKEQFLWICHRDNTETESANEALQVGAFEERLAAVQRHVDSRMNSLEAKLDAILDSLNSG